jgi:hypothetical protein
VGSFQIVGSGQSARDLSLCVHTGARIHRSPEEVRDRPSSRGTGNFGVKVECARVETPEARRESESQPSI